MTLEEFTSQLNAATFWREFTFSETKFSPRPKQEVELADGIVRIGTLAYVLQLKERAEETDDPAAERQWFQSKVIKKATKQIRDSVQYLTDNEVIRLTNEQGHAFDVRGAELVEMKKIIVFKGGRALPDDCRQTRFYLSKNVGFIHLIEARDYQGILEYIRVPDDVRRYFDYREAALVALAEEGVIVEEPDIMVGYLSDVARPVPNSRERLRAFVQDLEQFDLSHILDNLLAHIQDAGPNQDYYRILLEFGRVPRSVWRAFKERLVPTLDACSAGNFLQPYRFTYPSTDCSFMIASLDPRFPATGEEGEKLRANGLQMLTLGAKYAAKSKLGIGLLVSKSGDYFHLDWCAVDQPWERDEWIENMLATSNPFRPVKEKQVFDFKFQG